VAISNADKEHIQSPPRTSAWRAGHKLLLIIRLPEGQKERILREQKSAFADKSLRRDFKRRVVDQPCQCKRHLALHQLHSGG
jgi:hypothetical protein